MTGIPQGEDILAFLDREIAARETAARDADQGHWSVSNSGYEEWDAGVDSSSNDGGAVANCCIEEARHIVLNDPESVLRRCAADRKLIYEVRRTAYNAKSRPWDPMCGPYADAMLAAAKVVAEGYGWTESER
ncbi:DUF6221 family protein [Streptomyces sp. NPDC056192]|uniref:DUF6221 family protein n=1 Tax=Streptomyces sp. NPDC056192 TaxID=3345743 RepID=UPI0035DCCEE4